MINPKSPLVSVIIPAYNRAGSIGRSLQSVLNQSLHDFEIIVVDDASSDNTPTVIQSFADERIRLLRHERNRGAGPARNTAMQAALGQYIAWLDSDDEWFPDKLQVQLDTLRKAASHYRASYTAYEIVQQDFSKIHFSPESDLKRLFLGCDKAPGSTLLFERALIEEVGLLDDALRRNQDWDWLLRYSKQYHLLGVNQPLARIYYSPRKSAANVESSALVLVSKHSEYLRRYGIYRNKVISKRWMEVASSYAQEANLGKMAYYIFKSFSVYPFPPLNVWGWLVKEIVGVRFSHRFMKR
jgi:glycosyltransferase involved in cell wall biosynthesis